MSKETLADKLSSIKFKEESKSLRKKISLVILIALILGYVFLVLFNVFVAVSATGIRVETKKFDRVSVDDESIGIKGDILIRNDHWYSLDINDLQIEMEVETEDHKDVYDKTIYKSVIPRLKNTEIELDFLFTVSDIDLAHNETWIDLATTEELIIKFTVIARYTWYIMKFEIERKVDIE